MMGGVRTLPNFTFPVVNGEECKIAACRVRLDAVGYVEIFENVRLDNFENKVNACSEDDVEDEKIIFCSFAYHPR